MWLNTHFNTPKEFTPEAAKACAMLADAGILLGNQSVLLAGVNDCSHVKMELVHGLVKMRVRPYYIYACDPSLGLSHFRTPVSKGIEIMEALRGHTSGYCIPTFVVDAPGGGGNAMASLGLGMAVGDVSISLGTSGVAAAISENPTYDLTGAVSGFADCTGHYLPLACTINGSRILDAGRAALGVDYDELAKLAFASKPGAGGITLVPYFDGERTPNRPNATATFSGMTLANTTRENMARAFVEGLLCSQRDCLELIRSLGASITRILLIGGVAKSEAIRTLAPSILGIDVPRPATDEYVASGAARQAAWALSGETEPPAWQLTIDGVETGEPTEAVYEAYAKARG